MKDLTSCSNLIGTLISFVALTVGFLPIAIAVNHLFKYTEN